MELPAVRWAVVCCVLILSAMFTWSDDTVQKVSPKVVNGVIELSDWDITDDGCVDLDGEWKFYWEQMVDADLLLGTEAPEPTGLYPFPSHWTGKIINGTKVSGHGYATFELDLELDDRPQKLAFLIPEAMSAYRLYANGKFILSCGEVGDSKAHMTPNYQPLIGQYEHSGGPLKLVLQVSNFNHRNGGPWCSITLGTFDDLKSVRLKRIGMGLFVSGACILMSVYYLGMFMLRRKEKTTFYFSGVCLLLGVRALITGERWLLSIYDLDWEIHMKLEYLTFYLTFLLVFQFLRYLFPRESSRWLGRAVRVVSYGFVVVVLLTNANIYSYTAPLFQLLTVLGFLYMIFVLIRACKNRREGSFVFLGSLTIYLVAFVNDVLHINGIIQTGLYTGLAQVVFICAQSFLLSLRFSRSFERVETLSEELQRKNEALAKMDRLKDEYAHELEDKVDQRTRELNSALGKITQQSGEQRALLQVLCHDLANPLANIHSLLELSEEQTIHREEADELMKVSAVYGLRIIDLVRQMRYLDDKQTSLTLQKNNLYEMVNDSVGILTSKLDEKGIHIDLHVDESIEVWVERTSFVNSVLNNILTNALKFSFPHSTIKIDTTADDAGVRLSIRDEGIGMSEELIGEIFDYRKSVSRQGTHGEEGTGYGIPLVRKFVHAYNGEMYIHSFEKKDDSEEHGTEIVLLLKR